VQREALRDALADALTDISGYAVEEDARLDDEEESSD
jgi:hypothetical protein